MRRSLGALGEGPFDLVVGGGGLTRAGGALRRRLPRLRAEFPGLSGPGLSGGAEYFDARMDDARLCLEVVRTAALRGAAVANYVEATAFVVSGGQISGVRALDRLGGRE